MFRFFDPQGEIEVSRRNLPHWEQAGGTYFVTFRTGDSLPSDVMEEWKETRDRWLSIRGIDSSVEGWRAQFRDLSKTERDDFEERFSSRLHEFLDSGYGECVLKRRELSAMVAESLLHFDGDRYQMGDFVVMPNHVHLLVQLEEGFELKAQCYSWKKFTAGSLNAALGRSGHFWQGESYDRLVRDLEEFEHYRKYIAENPVMAGLREGESFYYRSSKCD